MSRVGCQVCAVMRGTGNRINVRILKFAKQMHKAFATGENKMPSRTFNCQEPSLSRTNVGTDVEGTQPNHGCMETPKRT